MTGKDEWGTPQWLFDELDAEFHFTLDPCASEHRQLKVMQQYTVWLDGLKRPWTDTSVFVNPPYSGRNIETWIRKADSETSAISIVMLIPVTKTGTKWFKELVLDKDVQMLFLTGRINFVPLAGQNNNSNPLYSMLLIWNHR